MGPVTFFIVFIFGGWFVSWLFIEVFGGMFFGGMDEEVQTSLLKKCGFGVGIFVVLAAINQCSRCL